MVQLLAGIMAGTRLLEICSANFETILFGIINGLMQTFWYLVQKHLGDILRRGRNRYKMKSWCEHFFQRADNVLDIWGG